MFCSTLENSQKLLVMLDGSKISQSACSTLDCVLNSQSDFTEYYLCIIRNFQYNRR